MFSYERMVESGFVHLLAASVIVGFAAQAQWAMDHSFEFFGARMLATAALVFLVLQGGRLLVLRAVTSDPARLNRQYSESALLLTVISALLVIDNLFLKLVASICYTLIVLRYMASVLEIQWARSAPSWLREKAAGILDATSARGLGYRVEDDTSSGVLKIVLRSGPRPASVRTVKETVAGMYQDLPDEGDFEEILVNVEGMHRLDETLTRCLDPVGNYAAMLNIEKVRVVADADRKTELPALLPGERFEIAGTAP